MAMVVTIMAHMCNLTPRHGGKTISICTAITQLIVSPTTHTLTPQKASKKKTTRGEVKPTWLGGVRVSNATCNLELAAASVQHVACSSQKVKRLLRQFVSFITLSRT